MVVAEKALREKLNTVIEDEFSKVALRNTIKYFNPHSENDCVGATIKVLEYSQRKKYQSHIKLSSKRSEKTLQSAVGCQVTHSRIPDFW